MRMAAIFLMFLSGTAGAQPQTPSAEPTTQPARKRPSPPKQDPPGPTPKKPTAPTTQPAAGRPNPFLPSDVVHDRAVTTRSTPAASRPILQGVIVKGKTVLACFELEGSSVIVEPGSLLGCGETEYEFVGYKAGLATLRQGKETLIKIRLAMRPAPSPTSQTPPPSLPGVYEE